MRYCYFAFLSIFLLHNILFSQIKFATTCIEDEVADGVNSYKFSFDFKNIGNYNIQITKVESSCSCTIPSLAKMNYNPNECGKIYGMLNLNNKTGVQSQEIVVYTDNATQPQLKLKLEVKILSPVEIKPRLVYWERNASLESKNFVIIIRDTRWKLDSVTCDKTKFSLMVNGRDNKYQVNILPVHTKKTIRDLIKVILQNNDSQHKTIFIHAIVK